MKNLLTKDLLSQLNLELKKEFPDEVFLPQEIQGALQGLIDSIHWSVLRQAQEVVHASRNQEIAISIDSLNTSDHFINRWMDRQEILTNVAQMSGLNDEISNLILTTIERIIDLHIADGSALNVELIGEIQAPSFPQYIIALARPLCIQCQSSGKPLSARKNKISMSYKGSR